VKVATRITVATAIVVALASAAYAYFDLRGRRAERIEQLAVEARAVANLLRLQLDAQFRVPTEAVTEKWREKTGWNVVFVPAARAEMPAALVDRQVSWLRAFMEDPGRSTPLTDIIGDRYHYAISLRTASFEPAKWS
jgi:hypothetical protein